MLFAVLAVLAAVSAPAPAEIYTSALTRLETLRQPAYIDTSQYWTEMTDIDGQQVPSAWLERVLFDSTARRECVLRVPYAPSEAVLISDSYFAPDMWLVHKPTVHAPAGQSNFAPDLSDLKTIAQIVSVAKPSYDIRLAGIDPVSNGGGQAYHLVLRPLDDPIRHNLRELWVSTTTYDIIRAVLVGYYRPDNLHVVQLTTVSEDFGEIGGYRLVVDHTWTYRDITSGATFEYRSAITQASFPAAIPAWYFDERQFVPHRFEVNSSSAWP